MPLVLPEVLIVSPAPLSMPPGIRQGDDDDDVHDANNDINDHDDDCHDDYGRGDDNCQPSTRMMMLVQAGGCGDQGSSLPWREP